MSDRVSDETLYDWSNAAKWWTGAQIARELLERRAADAQHEQRDAELEQWRALGESPEAVRAELERLRADLGQLESQRHFSRLNSRIKKPPTQEDYFRGRDPKRPPLEALEDVLSRQFLPNEQMTAETMVIALRAARRAAGEVL